ncbi:MAG: hypothetical protein ISS56_16535 [Anaerolineae bacterium]|nr:hypothetical protein [Anaerolineae bacterium]
MEERSKAREQMCEWRESRTVKRQDELVAGDEVVAALRWEGWGSTFASGSSPEGEWTFDRPRLLSRDVEVREAQSGELVAVYMPSWLGTDGKLEFADGRRHHWAATDFWRTKWVLYSASNEPLVHFEDTSGLLRVSAVVQYGPSSLPPCERDLFALLGWYLMALARRDAAAAAAATTVVIG